MLQIMCTSDVPGPSPLSPSYPILAAGQNPNRTARLGRVGMDNATYSEPVGMEIK